MIENILEFISELMGFGEEDLNALQMGTRVVIVYAVALFVVRIGEKRFLGENSAFDFILGIVLGSVISRSITGNAPFFPTLVAGFLLVALHWLFAAIAFRSHRFGTLVKGSHRVLVKDGEIQWDAMRKSHISENDLMEAVRSEGSVADLKKVKEARLERSGDISIIKASGEPKILEVKVEDGVQTVRMQLE